MEEEEEGEKEGENKDNEEDVEDVTYTICAYALKSNMNLPINFV